jgi:hypothetical protein
MKPSGKPVASFLAALALGAFAAAAHPAPSECDAVAGNLVVNCGFELGSFAGWTHSGNTVFDGVAGGGIEHSGNFGAFFGAVGSLGFISQDLATVPGDSYDLSLWLQSDGSTSNEFEVLFNGLVLTHVTNQAAFPYTQFTFMGLAATGASTELKFGFRDDAGFLYFDDVSVTSAIAQQVPEPGSLALMALALAGLSTWRRRLRPNSGWSTLISSAAPHATVGELDRAQATLGAPS